MRRNTTRRRLPQSGRGTDAAWISVAQKSAHRLILESSDAANQSGSFDLSVVLAQAASETCTEWALGALLRYRDVGDLVAPLLDNFKVKSIGHDRVRSLLAALLGVAPTSQGFWERLTKLESRRHKLVHSGKSVTAREASDSVEVVNEYVGWLEKRVAAKKPAK